MKRRPQAACITTKGCIAPTEHACDAFLPQSDRVPFNYLCMMCQHLLQCHERQTGDGR